MSPHTLYLASVWLHILAAMVWIGGSAFIALVLVPALKDPRLAAQAPAFLRAAAYRFRRVGWISLLVLVATGISNLALRGIPWGAWLDGSLFSGRFGHALAAKLALVAVILLVGAYHDFVLGPRAAAIILADPASDRAQAARRTASRMGRLTLALGLAVVACGVALVRGY
jgi:copper resistance protein D